MTDDLIVRLMEDLDGPWEEETRKTIHALASMGQIVVLPLLRAIEKNHTYLTQHAAQVLSHMQAHEALPHLIELIEENRISEESRLVIIDLIVSLIKKEDYSPELLDFLVSLSRELNADLRRVAVKGLGKFHFAEVRPILERLSRDMVEIVSREAKAQLQQFPEEPESLSTQSLDDIDLKAAIQNQKQGHPTTPQELEELLPKVRKAGTGTLEELLPLLRMMNRSEANEVLSEIVLDIRNSETRRIAALKGLQQLNDDDPSPLNELYEKLLDDVVISLKLAGLKGLHENQHPSLLKYLGKAILDEEPKVRDLAAQFLYKNLDPSDKTILRPILTALSKFKPGQGRLYLLRSLYLLLDETTSTPMLLPEVQEFLDSPSLDEIEVTLDIIKKLIAPHKPSPQLTSLVLKIFSYCGHHQFTSKAVEILLHTMPKNYEEASSFLRGCTQHFSDLEEMKNLFTLLGRIADEASIELLISFANKSTDNAPHDEALKNAAAAILDAMESPSFKVWKDEKGHYQHALLPKEEAPPSKE